MSMGDHYESLLAEHYSCMFGDFEAKVAEQRALLERLGVGPTHRAAIAVDLSCGSGFKSIALARLGFQMMAIDFSQRLLAELGDRKLGLPGGFRRDQQGGKDASSPSPAEAPWP